MKKILLLLIISISYIYASENDVYQIKCSFNNYPDYKKVYLYDFYNGRYNMVQTATVDNGNFEFKLTKENHPGIYKIRLSPDKVIDNILFNYENIEIQADYNNIPGTVQFIKSTENILLQKYMAFISNENNRERAFLYLSGFYDTTDHFFQTINSELERLKVENKKYINKLYKDNIRLIASKYIKYDQIPSIPATNNPVEKTKFLIQNYWANIDFRDTLLLYLPLFSSKIDNYYSLFENPNLSREEQENNFKIAAKTVITNSQINHSVFQYVLEKTLNDADEFGLYELYLHIVDNYAQGELCKNESKMAEISSKIKDMQSISIGKTAPDFPIDNELRLSSIDKEHIVVIFWLSNCIHCKKALKDLKELYSGIKEKNGEIVAVSIDTNHIEFKRAIFEGNYDWINICDFKGWQSDIVNSYHVSITPTMFLLDKNKKIIYKPLTIRQLKTKLEIKQ